MKDELKMDWFKYSVLCLVWFVGVVVFQSCEARADEEPTPTWFNHTPGEHLQRVRGHIRWFHKNVKNVVMKPALDFAPVIVEKSLEGKVDPLLTSMVISLESGFRPGAVGSRGEIGLTQILPGGACAIGQDLTTAAGQIEAGVKCLRRCLVDCATVERGLMKYATGECESTNEAVVKKIKWRFELYVKLTNQMKGE